MGQLAVGIISFFIIIIVLLFLLAIKNGGPNYRPDQLNAWNYGLTKVSPYSCMGFVGPKNQLLYQYNTDLNNNVTDNNLPLTSIRAPDAQGNLQTITTVPVMGRRDYQEPYLEKVDGKDVVRYRNKKGFFGTHKDCCVMAKQSGSLGAAVYDPKTHHCYVFDWMGRKDGDLVTGKPDPRELADQPLHQNELVNIFPIFREDLKDVSHISEPEEDSEQYVYMMPCGGQGYPPCVQQKKNDSFSKSWPPPKEGCSQTGDKGLIRLYRTPSRSALPYDENSLWEMCETMPYIRGFGYQPKDLSCSHDNPCEGNDDKWHWSLDPPQFDPKVSMHPWDPNKSNAWFMAPEQFAG